MQENTKDKAMNVEARLFALLLFGGLFACSPGDPVTNEGTASDTSAATAAADGNPTEAETPPNILFIVADDIGFTDLGAFGGEIATPNMDRLALGGLRLNNLHAAPACRNTRLMMMSSAGTVAANHPLPEAGRGGVLSLSYATIPELLQDAGYATYGAGKWDLGNVSGYTPADRGFDRSWMQLGGSSSYFAEHLMGRVLGFEDNGRTVELGELPDDFYVTEHYTDKMLEYISSTEEGTPWFAYMPYTAPHWPLQLPDDWLDRYAGRYDDGYDALRARRFEQATEAGVLPPGSNLDGFQPVAEPWSNLSTDEQRRYSRAQEIFAGMVEYFDMSVGRVIDYLEESGQLDNTVIVFSADHGASAGEHGVDTGRGPEGGGPTIPDHIDSSLENFGRPGSFIDHGRGFGEAATAPFKYQKGTLDEGGLRAAAFVHYPAAVEAGGVSNAFMTMMDFLPTFLEIAGTEHPGAGPYRNGREINDIVGRSAWPYLTGQAPTIHSPTDAAGWAGGDGGALIRGDYKIINRPPPGSMGATPWRLYDLASDPGERRDIAAENTALTAELVAEWAENWR
jgi:arylsulfatase